ncbi:hypothetical protein QJS10_CPB22g00752 [Acorus calamus]|uniref:Aminopeptidase N-like N-terminal domain-containing protein n=1 Tax=Acorus calamus TaxID=4465 RepID=A0AAV9C103_ACOCL|nr:hypothetical protein QJS10_CPB22g00752 [Acorus calamus]
MDRFKGQARLPKFAIPKKYDLNLTPDLSSCTFTGSVQISIDVVDDTEFLVLNAADLSIHENSVWFKNQRSGQVF